jgi:small subunit ribosomal protein S5
MQRRTWFKVSLHKGTVPHEQKGKYGAGKVLIKPAADGTGVIAGGAMRAVLEMAGIHNVLAKSQGSSNPHNVVKATIDALSKMRDAKEIAKNRGIDLKKVFEGLNLKLQKMGNIKITQVKEYY